MNRVVPTALKTAGLDSVAQWSLDFGCGLMDTCRPVALSDVVVKPTAVGPNKVNALITPRDETVEDGDGRSRVCTCGVLRDGQTR